MGRTFAYCRVSTTEQTAENQRHAIEAAGWAVEPSRIISETISGSVEAMKRPAFRALVDHKLEEGDSLVVLKLDRLGRDNIDVQQTITALQARGVRVVSLDLPAPDLTSANGKLILQMFAAFAEFERNRIRERTAEGLERARRQGKRLGRPAATGTTEAVQAAKREGMSQSQTAEQIGASLRTVKRHWNK
jgi:DNA invertase Pin-like site-specific DNA recombinase